MGGQPGKEKPSWPFYAFLVALFATSAGLAYHKLLWFDELMTLYVARRPSLSDLWQTLCDGPDPAPPLHLLAVRWSVDLFGENHIGIRMPAILGFLLMTACLKHLSGKGWPSWVGALTPLVTYGFVYAYEARAYALWMGLTALALVFWLEAISGRPSSKWSAAGLCLTVIAAVSTHWYAVLLIVPIGLGELDRSIQTKRWEPKVWLALGLGLTPLLFLGPLLANGKQYSGNFWAKPTWEALITSYSVTFRWPAFVSISIGVAILTKKLSRQQVTTPVITDPIPRHLLIASLALLATPVLEWVLAKVMSGGYTVRYALPAVVGLALVAAAAAREIEKRGLLAGWAITSIVMLAAIGLNIQGAVRTQGIYSWSTRKPDYPEVLRNLPDDKLPFVVTEGYRFLPLVYYYGANGLGRPIVYLPHEDPEKDTLWISMRKLRPLVVLPILDLKPFVDGNPKFYLSEHEAPYLRLAIQELGAFCVFRYSDGQEALYEVTRPTSTGTDADQQP